jgi:hypothetical protein
MTRKAYTVGDRFHFPGDWQTSEGTWEVVGLDDDLDQIICKPISGDAFYDFAGETCRFEVDFMNWAIKEGQWQRK